VKSASTTPSSKLPDQLANRVTGVDWASEDHAGSVVDDRGQQVGRKTVEHTAAGLRAMVTFLGTHGVAQVAIERGGGPVVDALLAADLSVVVISANQLLALHTAARIFKSLPRSGTVRAARLLAEIGDVRARFPDAASLVCLASVAPSTRQSGKHRAVWRCWQDGVTYNPDHHRHRATHAFTTLGNFATLEVRLSRSSTVASSSSEGTWSRLSK
jgi:hypothetical protein